MAVGQVSTTNGTGSSTAGVAATATITASVGDTLIVVAGSDDRASAEAMSATAVTDSAGNTWSRLGSSQDTDATANSNCALAIYGTTVTNALTGGTVTLTPVSTVPVKDFTLYRFTGLSLTIRGLNSGAGTGTTPAALATSAPLNGDLVIAAIATEGPTSDSFTGDSDTTNGSWSAVATDGTTGGTATGNIAIRSQYKIVNADGTQTFNKTLGTSRDYQQLIICLAPTPPPTAAGSPPRYVATYGYRTSVGVGRATASVVDSYAIGENFDPRLPPVVFHGGSFSDASQVVGNDLPSFQPIVRAILDAGFVIVGSTTQVSWGNSTAQNRTDDVLAWARTTFGASNRPAVMLGGSEGAVDALTYAYVNPAKVACVVGLIPLIDLQEAREQDIQGLRGTIDTAWGVTYPAALPSGADPMTAGHQATLATIPIQLWYATDDAVSANITAFRNGTGCDIRPVGPTGHSDTSIGNAWPTEIVKFIRKRVQVARTA